MRTRGAGCSVRLTGIQAMFNATLRQAFLMGAGSVIITLVAVGATVAPAFGKEREVVVEANIDPAVTRQVHFGDLNLMSPQGERTLKGRVKQAVSDICRTNVSGSTEQY